MKKTTVGLAALISLGASLGKAQSNQKENVELKESSSQSIAVDQIEVKLTQKQREDLYRALKKMGAKIGNWETYSAEAAPSKCTGTLGD